MSLVSELQKILDNAVASGEECGCQLTVYRYGELICELCAGYTDASQKTPVNINTLFPIFSVSKGVVSTLLHILAEKGTLSYDDLVVKYWPEYGCNGKAETTIRHVMSHRAGLFVMPPQLSLAEQFNWSSITSALASAIPGDKIGGKHHYHAYTYGALAGYIAELADGRTFNQMLQDEILEPLGINTLYFGLPEKEYTKMAFLDDSVFSDSRLSHNEPAVLSGLNPSSNGCANASAVARIYASLTGNGVDGVRLLNDDTVSLATILCRSVDEPLDFDKWDKFGLGYALCGPRENIGRMFGHGGAAGSEGFADKETGYAVGFTKNRLNATHPVHPVRNAISRVLGVPERMW